LCHAHRIAAVDLTEDVAQATVAVHRLGAARRPAEIARGRTPLPTISSMLKEMGAASDESGWLDVAYSLLSQITHSTPIGHLHVVRVAALGLLWAEVGCLGVARGLTFPGTGVPDPAPSRAVPVGLVPHVPVGDDAVRDSGPRRRGSRARAGYPRNPLPDIRK
jgi:hypothetical protein